MPSGSLATQIFTRPPPSPPRGDLLELVLVVLPILDRRAARATCAAAAPALIARAKNHLLLALPGQPGLERACNGYVKG